jgi:hypothetical protein
MKRGILLILLYPPSRDSSNKFVTHLQHEALGAVLVESLLVFAADVMDAQD